MIQQAVAMRPDTHIRRALSPILCIGGCSGLLYLVVYVMQEAIFRNGLLLSFAGVTVRGDTASVPWLLTQYAVYCGATVALFALYAWLLALCRRGYFRDRRVCMLALLFPVLFNFGLLFGRPHFSIDLFDYLSYGYLGSIPGGNPYVQPSFVMEHFPFGGQLVAFGWRPIHGLTPYGALWTWCEIAVMRLTEDAGTAVLLLKGLVIAASLGSAALIWAILGWVRPAHQLLGTLIYLWNPVIIVEFAAEGHNDALMILCILAALFLAVRTRPALALAMLLLGVLTKYVPVILLPAQMRYLWSVWRKRPDRARLIPLLLLGLLVGLALAALLYRPLWVGVATFRGLREESAKVVNASSTAGALYAALAHSPLRAMAGVLTAVLLDGAFALYVLLTGWRVRNARSLLRTCAAVAVVYVLVASPAYWPWYVALPIALLALCPDDLFLPITLIVSIGARLVAPLEVMENRGFITLQVSHAATAAIGVALPLGACLLLTARKWRQQRRNIHAPEHTVASRYAPMVRRQRS